MMEFLGYFVNFMAGFFIWAVDTIKNDPSWVFWIIGLGGSLYMAFDELLNIMLDLKKEYQKQTIRRG